MFDHGQQRRGVFEGFRNFFADLRDRVKFGLLGLAQVVVDALARQVLGQTRAPVRLGAFVADDFKLWRRWHRHRHGAGEQFGLSGQTLRGGTEVHAPQGEKLLLQGFNLTQQLRDLLFLAGGALAVFDDGGITFGDDRVQRGDVVCELQFLWFRSVNDSQHLHIAVNDFDTRTVDYTGKYLCT